MKRIALIGHGTIGRGVAEILLERQERIARAVGCEVVLARVADKDAQHAASLPTGVFTTDIGDIIADTSIDVAVELIGGLEPARTIVLDLLRSGKNVVTANKALLANHGAELFAAAREHSRTIAFEASVAGGIPVIASLATSLQSNTIRSIRGILNGTSNFILSAMNQNDVSYDDAVRLAQQLGYAEANPAMDVNGSDAAQKLAILTQLAFGVAVDWKKIPRQGIEAIEPIDFAYAEELGYVIKLIASAEARSEGLVLSVVPTLIPAESMLARVDGANNALELVGDSVGRLFYHGAGAGRLPTASAVVADVIDTLLGRTAITAAALQLWGDNNTVALPLAPDRSGRTYLRMTVENAPGVLSEISGVLGRHAISVASVIQHDMIAMSSTQPDEDATPLILTTHAAAASAMTAAIAALQNLPCVHAPIVRLSVQTV